MNFLEKLYENNLFAPILFGIIAVLAVLFIIVLILAMKDAKKNKSKKATQAQDAFNQVTTEPTEVNVDANKVEVKDETQAEENVISSVVPSAGSFENVNIEVPTNIDSPVIAVPEEQQNNTQEVKGENNPSASQEVVVKPAENEIAFENVEAPIQTENSPVSSVEEVKKAEKDLDEIAATLFSEYHKESVPTQDNVDLPKSNVEDVKQNSNDQFSSVFVTSDTLPAEEKSDENTVPSLNDIPAPQPVRVVNQSSIIDSSKKENIDVNNIETETYNLNK